MTPRRKSDAALPPAPLELVHPLEVGGGEVPEAVLLDELPPHVSPLLVRTLRLVTAWSAGVEAVAGWREEMEAWEWTLLNRQPYGDDEESTGWWAPAAVIADELRRPRRMDTERVSHACLALGDWCLAVEARISCLRFAEAAALASPALPRWAWIAGRLMRDVGRPRDAEHWLHRAIRVATWVEDWETQTRALNTLGISFYWQGNYEASRTILERGRRAAARHGSIERRGELAHDLAVVSGASHDYAALETYAKQALDCYGPKHRNLPRLAYDIVFFWIEQQRHARALPILEALQIHFTSASTERLRVLAAAARAAGACGDSELFDRYSRECLLLLEQRQDTETAAALIYDIALGAQSLRRWSDATGHLMTALDIAERREERDLIARIENALALVRQENAGTQARRPSKALADNFSRRLLTAVANAVVSPEDGDDAPGLR